MSSRPTALANRIKLAGFGLADRVADINCAAVRLARRAAEVKLAGVHRRFRGSVPASRSTFDGQVLPDLEAAFDEQLAALAEAGVDLAVLETFRDCANCNWRRGPRRGLGLPVLASFVPLECPPDAELNSAKPPGPACWTRMATWI